MMKPKFWYWSSRSRTNDYHSITQIVMTPKLPSIIITPKTHGKNIVWKRKMFVQPLAFACAGGLMRKMCWTFCTSYYTLITQTTPGPTSAFYHSFFSGEFTWKHKFTHVDARCHVVPTIIRYSYLCRYLCKVHIPILSLYDSLFFLQVVKCKGLTRAWCKRDTFVSQYRVWVYTLHRVR